MMQWNRKQHWGVNAASLALLAGVLSAATPTVCVGQEAESGVGRDAEKPSANGPVHKDLLGDPLPPGAVARFGTTRLLQDRGVRSLAFSPDSKVVVSVGYGEAIRVWEVATGKELPPFTREEHAAKCASFLPDGKTLVAGYSEDIILWDVARCQPVRHFEDKTGGGGASLLRVSPDGKMLVAVTWRETIRLWEISSGKSLGELQGVQRDFLSLAFSPDSRSVVACTGLFWSSEKYPHQVSLWEVPKAQPKWQTKLLGGVDSATFFPDGKSIALGTRIGPVHYLDAEMGHEQEGPRVEGRRVTVAADGKTLAVARPRGMVQLCDAVTGRDLHSLRGHGSAVRELVFSPDGKVLATGDDDGTVVLWDTATGRELHPMPGHRYRPGAVAFLPDGRSLVSRGGDETIRVWDLTSGKESLRLDVGIQQEGAIDSSPSTDLATSLACTPDGKLLATWGPKQSVLVWNARTGKQRFTLTGHEHRLTSVAFAPDGKTLASCDASGVVRLWDAAEGKLARVLTTPPPGSRAGADWLIQFSPDSKRLAAHSRGTMAVWDLAKGSQLWSERHKATSLLFCGNGKLLAAAWPGSGKEPNTIRLIEVTSGEVIRSLTWPTRNRGSGVGRLSLALSPDGRYLASADGRSSTSASQSDWDLRVWDLLAGRQVLHFLGHRGPLNGVAFSSDGKRLASASDDGTVLVWDLLALPRESEALVRKGLDAATLDRLWSDLGDAAPPTPSRR